MTAPVPVPWRMTPDEPDIGLVDQGGRLEGLTGLLVGESGGIDPAVSLQRVLIHGAARTAVAFVWVYQGVAPKLLVPHPDELTMLRQAGVPPADAPACARLLGGAEVAFGLLVLLAFHRRWPLWLSVGLMIAAPLGAAVGSAPFLWAGFNPVSLNLAVGALAGIGLLAGRDLTSARHCLRRQPRGGT